MALLYTAEIDGARALVELLHRHPSIDLRIWPETGPESEIEFAVVEGESPVDLRRFENLRGVQSTWAGVDRLLDDPHVPAQVPLARMLDEDLTRWMSEYVVFQVLDIARQGIELRNAQSNKAWLEQRAGPPKPEIGILGLGELGTNAARRLAGLGFSVLGWSRNPRLLAGVECHAGPIGLRPFLGRSGILVCLLPLTPRTKGILNTALFADLPAGASLIQAGRGPQLVEADLLHALDVGHLGRAILDVFAQEPLPRGHPFWSHSRITVTPHVSAISRPGMGAALIIENYRRAIAGEPLAHQVDRELGY